MAKIGNLWVKLGLKSDDFSKGLNQAASKTKSFANEAGKMVGGLVAKFASVTAAITAVTKFLKDCVELTQKWGDAWAITMDGVKAAYGTFVRQLSSGDGWDNLFSNMAEAYQKGKEIASVLDEIFERKVSYSYAEAEANKYISEQQLIMRDASHTDQERMKAAQNIIDKEKELGQIKKQVWTDEAKAYRDQFQLATGLNDEQTDYLLKNYNLNREVINQSKEYYAERTKLQKQLSAAEKALSSADPNAYKNYERIQDSLTKLEETTSDSIKTIAEWAADYDKSNDELVNNMSQAEIAVINIDTEVNKASMRATAMLGSLTEATNRQAASVKELAQDYSLLAEAMAGIAYRDWADNQSDEMLNPLSSVTPLSGMAETGSISGLAGEYEYLAEKEALAAEKSEDLKRKMQDLAEFNETFNNAIIFGFSDAIQQLTDQLMGLEEINPGAIVQTLLQPLLDLARRTGEILVLQGTGIEAFKESLLSLQGGAAIAAGLALIGISAAASSALRGLAGGYSSSSTTSTGTSMAAATTSRAELTVYVKGTIKGSDILISGQNTQSEWNK